MPAGPGSRSSTSPTRDPTTLVRRQQRADDRCPRSPADPLHRRERLDRRSGRGHRADAARRIALDRRERGSRARPCGAGSGRGPLVGNCHRTARDRAGGARGHPRRGGNAAFDADDARRQLLSAAAVGIVRRQGDRVTLPETGLVALDAATGERLWRTTFWGSWVESTPTLAGGVLYVGSSDMSRVSAIDPGEGTVLWRTQVHGWTFGTPLVVGERSYAGAAGGTPTPSATSRASTCSTARAAVSSSAGRSPTRRTRTSGAGRVSRPGRRHDSRRHDRRLDVWLSRAVTKKVPRQCMRADDSSRPAQRLAKHGERTAACARVREKRAREVVNAHP